MKKIVILLAAVCCSLGTAVYGQTCLSDEIAYRIKSEGFSNSKIEEISQFMTDDLGPRLAASQMKLRSEKMVVEKLAELGLSNPRIEFAFDFPKGGWDNEMNYVAMIDQLSADKIDLVIAGLNRTEEREKRNIIFSKNYINSNIVMLVRSDQVAEESK